MIIYYGCQWRGSNPSQTQVKRNVRSGNLPLDHLAGGYHLFNHKGTYGPFVCLRKEYKNKATSDVIIISACIRPYSDYLPLLCWTPGQATQALQRADCEVRPRAPLKSRLDYQTSYWHDIENSKCWCPFFISLIRNDRAPYITYLKIPAYKSGWYHWRVATSTRTPPNRKDLKVASHYHICHCGKRATLSACSSYSHTTWSVLALCSFIPSILVTCRSTSMGVCGTALSSRGPAWLMGCIWIRLKLPGCRDRCAPVYPRQRCWRTRGKGRWSRWGFPSQSR